ncbi:MAG: sulfatase-like hydrolase/transferase [Planctomycetales bacterium]|nr:sulfatase-like hydrolase/transferase [Planctomycetales bacterium]
MFSFLLAAAIWSAEPRPNILVLFADDLRYNAIGALGNDEVKTPHLDELARRGTTFTHCFQMGSLNPAVCMPSRAMLMSGRTLFHVPVQLTGVKTWPQYLRERGYATYGIGKWHNGPASYAAAFDEGAAVFFGGMSDHFKLPIFDHAADGKYPKTREKAGDRHSSELFADEAIRFLRTYKRDQPFFLYCAFWAPHDPRTAPPEYAKLYDPARLKLPASFLPEHPFDNGELRIRDELLAGFPRTKGEIQRQTADYYAMITHLDAQIGRILKSLDETGQAKNTIIIFTADNGLALGRHGLMGKQNLYDHSVRVPLLMAGPGIPIAKQSDALCYLLDLFPTTCDLATLPIPKEVEGKSLRPILEGKETRVRSEIFGAYRDFQRSIRTDRWKLIRYPQVDVTQLFDLQNDPDEITNLASKSEHAERVASMTRQLAAIQKSLDDPLPLTARPKK